MKESNRAVGIIYMWLNKAKKNRKETIDYVSALFYIIEFYATVIAYAYKISDGALDGSNTTAGLCWILLLDATVDKFSTLSVDRTQEVAAFDPIYFRTFFEFVEDFFCNEDSESNAAKSPGKELSKALSLNPAGSTSQDAPPYPSTSLLPKY